MHAESKELHGHFVVFSADFMEFNVLFFFEEKGRLFFSFLLVNFHILATSK
jgi:hypothetical protein